MGLMLIETATQGELEDLILRHRFLYYVMGQPVITDGQYDALERAVRARWSVSVVSHGVGSSLAADYPEYIRMGVRPNWLERIRRDHTVVERWLDHL